jgi:UDP-glucose 4-epimerase
LGRRVVSLLARDPSIERITAIDCVPAALSGPTIEHHLMDLSLADGLDGIVRGASSVIHLAWSPGASGNGLALRRVLAAVAGWHAGTFVHLSSATVYGAWPDNPVPLSEGEALRPSPGFSFAVEKAEGERLVTDWAEDHPQVAVAVLRPSVTVGSAGPPLYRALAGTALPPAGDDSRPMQFLHVDDLAAAVIAAHANQLRGVYNVAPDGWITEDTARNLAGGVARVRLPSRVVRAATAWAWDLWGKGTPREALPYAEYPWVVANDRLRATGWVPRYTNEEALVSSHEGSLLGDLSPNRRLTIGLAVGVAAGLGALAAIAAGLASRVRGSGSGAPREPWRSGS